MLVGTAGQTLRLCFLDHITYDGEMEFILLFLELTRHLCFRDGEEWAIYSFSL